MELRDFCAGCSFRNRPVARRTKQAPSVLVLNKLSIEDIRSLRGDLGVPARTSAAFAVLAQSEPVLKQVQVQ